MELQCLNQGMIFKFSCQNSLLHFRKWGWGWGKKKVILLWKVQEECYILEQLESRKPTVLWNQHKTMQLCLPASQNSMEYCKPPLTRTQLKPNITARDNNHLIFPINILQTYSHTPYPIIYTTQPHLCLLTSKVPYCYRESKEKDHLKNNSQMATLTRLVFP